MLPFGERILAELRICPQDSLYSTMPLTGRSRRVALPFLAAPIILLAFLIPYLLNLPFLPPFQFLVGGLAAGAALIALFFVPAFQIAHLEAPPDAIRRFLAQELRQRGFTVAEKENEILVPLGYLPAAKLVLLDSAKGTDVRLVNAATTTGWGTLVTVIILVWTSWAAVAMMLYIHLRVDAFERATLAPLLATEPIPASLALQDEVSVLLVDSLAEAHRLAKEAHEAARDVYQGRLALAVLVTILGWFLLFLAFAAIFPEPDYSRRILRAALIASGLAAALGAGTAMLVHRTSREELTRQKRWGARLREAWMAEAAGEATHPEGPGPFELLLDASQEVPRWLDASRRAGMARDPGSWMLVFALLWGGVGVASFLFFETPIQLLAIGAMAGLILAAVLYYRSWRQRRDAVLAREQAEWNRRYEEVRTRMERYLEGV